MALFKPLLGRKRFAEIRMFDGSTPCVFVSLLAGGAPIYSGQTPTFIGSVLAPNVFRDIYWFFMANIVIGIFSQWLINILPMVY